MIHHVRPFWSFWLLCSLVFFVYILRLFDVMVMNGSRYRERADENRFFSRTILPLRGILFDRNDTALTVNKPLFLTSASGKTNVAHPDDLVEITATHAATLAVSSPSQLIGDVVHSSLYSPELSHLIGYVGFSSPNKMERVASVDERVGKTGLERALNNRLRGGLGKSTYEMSANGRLERLVAHELPRSGESIRLSIDQKLSLFIVQTMGDMVGAAVVSEPQTGKILALISTPGFTTANFSAALVDERKPLLNRALSAYPPGSTFKLITAVSALENKDIDEKTKVNDEGELKVGTQVFGNWYWRQYGRKEGELNLTKALARSNDIFFYTIAAKVGPEKIARTAKFFGLGSDTGIELDEDQSGLIPDPKWKEQYVGEKWFLGDTYHMGIGQGFILASPLQVNRMVGSFGRDGILCVPSLLLDSEKKCQELGVSKAIIDLVVLGMEAACSEGGTAFPFFALNAGVPEAKKIACKTGTAEFGATDNNRRKRTHAWFAMIYPKKEAKVAITVFLESTKEKPYLEGSADAAPIARRIFEKWQELGYDK